MHAATGDGDVDLRARAGLRRRSDCGSVQTFRARPVPGLKLESRSTSKEESFSLKRYVKDRLVSQGVWCVLAFTRSGINSGLFSLF